MSERVRDFWVEVLVVLALGGLVAMSALCDMETVSAWLASHSGQTNQFQKR